jgi:hypothetical protein
LAAHRTRTADVVVAVGGRVIPVLLQLTRSVPIIVPGGSDPVASGWIESVRRPDGNLSGFAVFELSIQRSGRYRRSITARREAANSSARMYFASHDRLGATGA